MAACGQLKSASVRQRRSFEFAQVFCRFRRQTGLAVGRMVNGKLYIASRKRDLIIRGGENVYPFEVEQRLEAHPDVAEAAVIGVDHEELGQEVKAVIVLEPGRQVGGDELREWVSETLSYYKVPTLWQARDVPLPRNATGKVLKNALRDPQDSMFIEE